MKILSSVKKWAAEDCVDYQEFSAGDVRRTTGLSYATLRRYEQLGAIKVRRNEKGRLVFTCNEIAEILRKIEDFHLWRQTQNKLF